jgi:UDP-glucose 4-epimerase
VSGCANDIRIIGSDAKNIRNVPFNFSVTQKLANKAFTVVGDGTQTRDFLYVTDVARAFLAAAETDHVGRIYNLGAGKPQSVNRLIELLGGDKTYIPKRPGEPDCTWADISRITSELGWQPLVSFEQGVANIVFNIDYCLLGWGLLILIY